MIRVIHLGKDRNSTMLTMTEHEELSSWEIDGMGNLTVGDSMGDPEAAYAAGHWMQVSKIDDED